MTDKEFQSIWNNQIAKNGQWYIGATAEGRCEFYYHHLKGMDMQLFKEAVELMIKEIPESDGLPLVGSFYRYCLRVKSDRTKKKFIAEVKDIESCKCCGGSTWILSAGSEVAYDCPSCYLKAGNKPRTNYFQSVGVSLCENLYCTQMDRGGCELLEEIEILPF